MRHNINVDIKYHDLVDDEKLDESKEEEIPKQ